MINKSKKSLRTDPDYTVNKSIDTVTDDVVEWANKKDTEIAQLNEMESYRRNFLGNISHELKTPIFSMQGYLHTLLEGGIHDERINVKYLQRAAANLERLESIVDDLEMINRLESGKIELSITSFDLKSLVKEVIKDMQFLTAEKDIKIKFKSGASNSYMIDADQEQIRQVINNLIVNSIKYGKEGGVTKVAFYDVDEGILIEVSDNGIGIKTEHLNHLFDRFYRVDAGRGRKAGGSGLGLAIVKHIVEAHNQTITARSTEGVGSTFGFTVKKSKKQLV